MATDATSAITSWNIVLILTGESGIDTENEPGSVIDYGADNAGDNGYRMQDPGNWVMTSSTALPEPQNGLIFLLGVLGIAFVARKRILQSTRQTTQTQQ